MPELPEVEIWRENLERWLRGRRIRRASVGDVLLRGGQPRRRVEKALEGATLRGVSRRGKYLLFDLGTRRPRVLVHLGMTGSFERVPAESTLPKFTRVVLELPRGERLAFSEARRLGQFRLVGDKEQKRLERLGVEPLSPELTARKLAELLERSSRPVKLFLMDQQRIAGIGNIQAAEALFLASIHPERAACKLTAEETKRLARSIRRALRAEIQRSRGDALRYLREGGDNHFLVYGRAGEPCPRCRNPIARLSQGGRSTYYCPTCQPKRKER